MGQGHRRHIEAIRLDPKNSVAYYRRGCAYKGKGEPDKADHDFAKAKELGSNPRN